MHVIGEFLLLLLLYINVQKGFFIKEQNFKKLVETSPFLRLIKQAFIDNYVLLLHFMGLYTKQIPDAYLFYSFQGEKKILQVPLWIELLLIKHNAQGAHKN